MATQHSQLSPRMLFPGLHVHNNRFSFRGVGRHYALISLFITNKTIDLVQQGVAVGKIAYIITQDNEKVRDTILFNLMRGCTEVPTYGGFTGAKRSMLMTVVSRNEVSRLKEMVYKIDPQAFVIVSDAQEVLGEGFTLTKVTSTAHLHEQLPRE